MDASACDTVTFAANAVALDVAWCIGIMVMVGIFVDTISGIGDSSGRLVPRREVDFCELVGLSSALALSSGEVSSVDVDGVFLIAELLFWSNVGRLALIKSSIEWLRSALGSNDEDASLKKIRLVCKWTLAYIKRWLRENLRFWYTSRVKELQVPEVEPRGLFNRVHHRLLLLEALHLSAVHVF